MTDRNAIGDPNETPEDVATLYSWANLHGAKYRDFSASRAQTREKARQRVQEAIEAERRRSREEVEIPKSHETPRAADVSRAAETERHAELVSREGTRRMEQQPVEPPARVAEPAPRPVSPQPPPQRPWQPAASSYTAPATHYAAPAPIYSPPSQPYAAPVNPAPAAPSPAYYSPQPAQPQPQPQYPSYSQQQPYAQPQGQPYAPSQPQQYAPAQPQNYPPAQPQTYPQPPAQPYPPAQSQPYPYPQAQPYTPPVSQPAPPASREEHYLQTTRTSWTPIESREPAARPAWLTSDRAEPAPQPVVPQAPEDTLQGSRDRLTSRWFALKGVFAGPAPVVPEALPAPTTSRAPVLAVFSLAGGVGKTSLVATLGRALSARGERVLLVDTAAFGLLPFFFGARDQRPGVLRTFSPPGASGDAPIQLLTVDPETLGPENAPQEVLGGEITRNCRNASRIIVDLATASGATTRRILRMSPTVLVPVIPDMSSVVSVGSIDAFFQRNPGGSGQPVMPFYVFNQFDPSLPLHLDVREVLREQLGDRLLPFALRRTPAVSEALAEGMTVVDYAPNSTVAEDFGALAGWVKSLAAPALAGFRGVRWSER